MHRFNMLPVPEQEGNGRVNGMHVNIGKLFGRQCGTVESSQDMVVIGFVGPSCVKKHSVAVKRNNPYIIRGIQIGSFLSGLMMLPYTLIFMTGLSLLSVSRKTVS